ncbi:MAG: TlpA family protein disulfide reductase [Planctomyces sp.]|nr:TlpA family protein disulfide reductase [Planctomyces sp.]
MTLHGTSFFGVPSTLLICVMLVMCSTHADEKAPEEVPAPPEVALTAGTWENVQEFVAKHPGKIVIVDIWSTSCLPCMTEFPGLVALKKAHPEDVVCISYNVDYSGIKSKPAETYRARVEKFLVKNEATFTNILSTQAADEVFEKLKLASIPAVYVYGRDGKLAKRFDESLLEDGEEEAFTYKKDINPFVEDLVSKK